ncbi:extracellular solute-binding protein [Streptosporangium sp. CA-115845]|uniref:extracellular solute-binding protein n=1 Tax=Streptosporangium sp. CA-115845 TaxID=3240071 RepID=UPI003D8E670F
MAGDGFILGSGRAIQRRDFLRLAMAGAAAVGSVPLLAACGAEESGPAGSAAKGGGITYASYGGTTEDAVKKAWGTPYTTKYGTAPRYASPVELGKIRAMVEADSVEWDVVQASFSHARNNRSEQLYQVIDTSKLDTSDIIENAIQDRGIGAYVLSYVIAYNNEKLGDRGPKSWAEFYDVNAFTGMRGVENDPQIILETALLGDGVKPEELYPLDLDRAFKKLDAVKSKIVWYKTGAEQQQLIQSGTVDLLVAWNGRAYDLITKGAPVSVEFNQQLTYVGYHVIPNGAKNVQGAMDFIGVSLEPANQAAFAELTSYAPVSKKAVDLVGDKVRPLLPTAPENLAKAVWVKEDYWVEKLDEVSARWTEWQVA